MGHQLWISPNTGIRRKGTTFKEIQSIFIDQITVKFICEPIYSCRVNDNWNEIKEALEYRDFDIVTVMDESNNIVGYVRKQEPFDSLINDILQEIDQNLIINDSVSISKLFHQFENRDFAFVMANDIIESIVTKADVNKPIVRIYLFGIVSLSEMHLNYWINHYYHEDDWKKLLGEPRLTLAHDTFNKRQGNNQNLSLLECIQLCDKREILRLTNEFLDKFEFSKTRLKNLFSDVEIIRNELAHSQDSLIENLTWDRFKSTILELESFLSKSESIVEDSIYNNGGS